MAFLEPRSIAVIGASSDPKKVGHAILRNLLTQGYAGSVYPVNPKGGEIFGKAVYRSVGEIPKPVDMGVIVTPAATVVALAEECGKKRMKTLIVISAGFGESHSEEGKRAEEKLVRTAKKYSMHLIGPNCLGILRPNIYMNASFADGMPKKGNVAFISQSGALAVALLDQAAAFHMGFSCVVSMGNKAATDECDFLEACEHDPQTSVIGLYLESIKRGKKFLEVAERVAVKKPIILIKAGTSDHGRRAVSSHTGALAGSDAAIDAACRQTGIWRAKTTEEFLDLLRTFSTQPRLPSSNIAIITNAGGPGILATDAAEKFGLSLPNLQPSISKELKRKVPPAASVANPIDVLGDTLEDRYEAALIACGKDPGIEGVICLLTPQIMTPVEKIAEKIVAIAKKYPLMPFITSFMGGERVKQAVKLLEKNGIPTFETPERAVGVMASLRSLNVPSSSVSRSRDFKPKTGNKPQQITRSKTSLKNEKGLLSENRTETLLASYGLPLPKQALARSPAQAGTLARRIGFPVIAKISSPQIIHKTDVGGVRLNLVSEEQVQEAFREIARSVKERAPEATTRGILIQKQLPAGNEFIVGAIKDPFFGHLIMVGLGGIYTELFKDSAFRIAPVSTEDAYEMLQELTSWKLLLGLRGKKRGDIDALVETIVRVSTLSVNHPEIQELDLNPVIVDEENVTIADAKIIVG